MIKYVDRLANALLHRMGYSSGRVETWTRRDGNVMIGFRCDTCGQLHDIRPSDTNKDYSASANRFGASINRK